MLLITEEGHSQVIAHLCTSPRGIVLRHVLSGLLTRIPLQTVAPLINVPADVCAAPDKLAHLRAP